MTLQDLKNNRDRIIKNINRQSSAKESVNGVMSKMLVWLNSREDIKDMKPTMKNLDKFTSMVIISWIKFDYTPNFTKNEQDAFITARKMDNLPSSMR